MAIQKFKLETIPKVGDGKIATQFNKLLNQAIADCQQRPGEKKPRHVVLDVIIVPLSDPDVGGLETIDVEFGMKIKCPDRISATYNMGVKANGTTMFNDQSEGRYAQMTLDEQNGREEPDEEADD